MAERLDIEVRQRGARRVKRDITEIGGAATAAAGPVRALQKLLLGFGIAIGLVSAVNTLREFGQEMSTVRAITGATAVEFQGLENRAKELGASTRFSATEAAGGLSFLARAGFSAAEAIDTVDDTLNLAQAGGLGLARAADIASNVLTGFRLETDQSGRVVDVLAKAANSANTDVNQLGDALKFVAPVAASFGVAIEEATAAVGVLSDAGLQGSLAGTGLRRVLSELESNSPKTRKVLASLGLTSEDVRISTVGLTEAITALAQAGLDGGTALEIFGDRGGPAFEVLKSALPDMIALNEALKDSEGFAERVAVIMDSNLNGAFLSVKSAVEALVISFGDLFSAAPPAAEVDAAIKQLEEDLESGKIAQDEFNQSLRETLIAGQPLTQLFFEIADGIRFIANNLSDLSAALLALVPVITFVFRDTFIFWVEKAKRAVLVLWAVLLANPFIALAALISAAVAALILFQDEISFTEDGFVSLGDAFEVVLQLIGDGLEWMNAQFKAAADFLASLWPEMFSGLDISFEGVLRLTARFMDSWFGLWIGTISAIGAAITGLGSLVVAAVKDLGRAMLNALREFVVEPLDRINQALGLPRSPILELFDVEEGEASEVAQAWEDLGTSVVESFKRGFNFPAIEGALDAFILKARLVAGERRLTELPEPPPVVPPPATEAGTTAGGGGLTADEIEKLTDAFNGLLASVSLVADADQELAEAQFLVDFAINQSLITAEEGVEIMTRLEREIVGVGNGATELADKINLLDRALNEGKISWEEYEVAVRDARIAYLETQRDLASGVERAFLKLAEEATDFASIAEKAVTGAFDKMSTALADFIKTGTVSFEGFIDFIIDNIARAATAAAFLELGGLFGAPGATGGSEPVRTGFAETLGGLLGLQGGGEFQVGAQTSPTLTGADNRLVAFRAKDRETITVTPAGQEPRGRGGVQIGPIFARDASSFGHSASQLAGLAWVAGSRSGRRFS